MRTMAVKTDLSKLKPSTIISSEPWTDSERTVVNTSYNLQRRPHEARSGDQKSANCSVSRQVAQAEY